jgi:hypothetical protein
VRLAHRLQLGLDVAQLGQAGFQRGGGFGTGGLHALLFLGRVAAASGTTAGAASACPGPAGAVAGGHLGLLLELVEVVVQLAQDVVHARQVLARVLQPVLGLAAAFLVLADAGGLFQEQAQLFGPRSMMRLMVPWPMMA